jgi:hypothetical protein
LVQSLPDEPEKTAML